MAEQTHPWRRYVALGDSLTEGLQDLERAWVDKSFARCFQFPGDKTCTVRRDGILFDWRNRK